MGPRERLVTRCSDRRPAMMARRLLAVVERERVVEMEEAGRPREECWQTYLGTPRQQTIDRE